MKIIQIAKGIHGVRQIAAARADVELRKLGRLPRTPDSYSKGKRIKSWTDEQFDEAQAMRLRGESNEAIGIAINRTTKSVDSILGYSRKSHQNAPVPCDTQPRFDNGKECA